MAGSRPGPAPKPVELAVVRGQKKSRRRTNPKPTELPVKPVRKLSGYAKSVWDRKAPDLIAQKVLTHWDADLFTSFCMWAAIEQQALDDVEKRGNVVDGDRGKVKNPSMQIARDAATQLLAIGARFGLTPSDRGLLNLGKGPTDGKGEDLLTT